MQGCSVNAAAVRVQVALAFRRLEECLTLAPLDPAWLDEPEHAVLKHTRITDRREVKEPGPDPDSPAQRTWEFLCHVVLPPNGVHYGVGAMGDPAAPTDPSAPAAASLAALQPGRTVWMQENALPLAFIKVQEEAVRSSAEYEGVLRGEEDEPFWLLGPPGSGGVRGRPRPRNPRHTAVLGAAAAAEAAAAAAAASAAAAAEDSAAAAAAAESMASRRSRRNVGRKVYYDDEGEEVDPGGEGGGGGGGGGHDRGGGYGYGQHDAAAEPPPAAWDGGQSRRPQRNAGTVQVGLMDAPDTGRGKRKPGPKRALSTDAVSAGMPRDACLTCVGVSAGKSGVLQPWVPAALDALDQVSKLDIAEAFRVPVPRAVPFYHDIVKKPMDLGTVADKLEKGVYQALPELQADMQRIWDNCALFNEPESDIAGAGRHLADFWRRVGSNDALLAATSAAGPAAGQAPAPPSAAPAAPMRGMPAGQQPMHAQPAQMGMAQPQPAAPPSQLAWGGIPAQPPRATVSSRCAGPPRLQHWHARMRAALPHVRASHRVTPHI